MKKLIFLIFLSACNIPSREEVRQDCQMIVDEAREGIWDECTNYYESEILPILIAQIQLLDARLDYLETLIIETCGATP